MKYDLKEHGLIDEEGKVTLVGRVILQDALKASEHSESDEFKPEYSSCWDKNEDEVKKWEEENKSLCLFGFNEGLIEICPTRFYREEGGKRIYDLEEFLSVATVSDGNPSEALMYLWSKENIIKLRDYLTKFIEKEEDWYKLPKNI